MKKIIAMLACLTMLLSMAACGTTEPEKTEGTTEPTTQATEATTEPTTEATEDTTEATEGTADATVGETLLGAFKADPTGTAQEIADRIITNPVIQFMPVTMAMEPGFLMGFNADITGFEECVTFAPMIGTIPFVGYIFTLAEGADVEAFKTTLSDNANLRWNICTAAEEMVVENEGNTVFFLMCPASFEQPEVEGDEGLVEDFPIDDMPAAEGEGIVLG
jgi:hypothetical protein